MTWFYKFDNLALEGFPKQLNSRPSVDDQIYLKNSLIKFTKCSVDDIARIKFRANQGFAFVEFSRNMNHLQSLAECLSKVNWRRQFTVVEDNFPEPTRAHEAVRHKPKWKKFGTQDLSESLGQQFSQEENESNCSQLPLDLPVIRNLVYRKFSQEGPNKKDSKKCKKGKKLKKKGKNNKAPVSVVMTNLQSGDYRDLLTNH